MEQQQNLELDFQSFVKIMDVDSIYEEFKTKIMNKQPAEFASN